MTMKYQGDALLGNTASGDATVPTVHAATPALTPTDIATAQEALRRRSAGFAKRVAPLYIRLGWEWGDGRTAYVPDAAAIEKTLHELIDGMSPWECAPHTARIETGGLFAGAERRVYKDGTHELVASMGFTDDVDVYLTPDSIEDGQ